jgi:protein-S-isoprenylcysteine O-methyltransferase Ste14
MTQTSSKNWLIRVGDFLFKWRNYLFPVIVLGLFLPFVPTASYMNSVALEEAKDAFAIFLVLAGLAFRSMTIGWAYIKRGGLNKQVYADKLVTGGFFGVCRNPLYVGNILIYVGLFVLHGHPLVIILGTALYIFIYLAITAAEEYFLTGKFGEEYSRYCAAVPRFIPDFSKYKAATAGMNFSVRRALFKDYTTIFNSILAVVVVESIENIRNATSAWDPMMLFSLSLFACATVLFVSVGYIKKTSNAKI